MKYYKLDSFRMLGMQGAPMSNQVSMLLQVHQKDVDKAVKYMAVFESLNK